MLRNHLFIFAAILNLSSCATLNTPQNEQSTEPSHIKTSVTAIPIPEEPITLEAKAPVVIETEQKTHLKLTPLEIVEKPQAVKLSDTVIEEQLDTPPIAIIEIEKSEHLAKPDIKPNLDLVESSTVELKPTKSDIVQSGIVQSNIVQSDIVQSDIVQSDIVQSNIVQSGIVQSNIVQSGIVQSNIVQSNIVQSNIAKSNTVKLKSNPKVSIEPTWVEPENIEVESTLAKEQIKLPVIVFENIDQQTSIVSKQPIIQENLIIEPVKAPEIKIVELIGLAVEPAPIIKPDIWKRLQNGMKLPSVQNKRIEAQKKWYLNHKSYLERVMRRAKPLLPFILDEIDERQLASEFALLPIVESAYQTYAYSHGRASGIWQIIPSTGRYLGLKQNWWYDGRRDLYLSSKAALKYLDMLRKQFKGDSVLALASYNAGPGKIRSAIRYNKRKKRPTDFWSLTKIRPETRDYVPKLYALKEIFSHPEKYGISLLEIEDEPGFDHITINKQLDITVAAELAEISLNEFYQLNPAFNHWATPPNTEYHLLLPVGKKATFVENFANLPASQRIKWVRHKIKPGETLSHIANRFNSQVSLIKKVNKIRGSQIRAGKHLMIPTSTKRLTQYSKSQTARLIKTQNTRRGDNKIKHTVIPGESLWTIAKHYGVSHKSLAKWNAMAPIDTLTVGRTIVIWNSNKHSEPSLKTASVKQTQNHIKKVRYTVRKGDSISRIANKFNIRISDIKKWNRIGKYIQPGQKIKLWVDVTRQSI